jgi:transcriptional regulator NrdR family protein
MPTSFDDTKEECPSCKSKDTELEFNTYEYPMEKSRYCKKCGDKYTNLESVHKVVKQFVKGKKTKKEIEEYHRDVGDFP